MMLVRCEKRHALFLQGTGSYFFSSLSKKLQALEIETSKIHLCFGDRVFWRGGDAVNYNGTFQDWPDYLQEYVLENGVTDIILFSDSRPYHCKAVQIAKSLCINAFVFENGYVRPHWITMERNGVNGRSNFPADPQAIRDLSEQAAVSTSNFAGGSPSKAMQLYFGDTTFHTLNFVFGFLFPRYQGFRNVTALTEARGWLKKFFSRRGKVRRSDRALEQLFSGSGPIFFFPLQLEHDYQLKVDSTYDTIEQASNEVIASFAANAPANARLLIKNHPLDNNTIDREAETKLLAHNHNVGDRVVFIEVGLNPEILKRSAGMVTINSTMGTAALFHNVPMCVLGNAIYKIKGLVHEGTLDSFWQSDQVFDTDFSRVFREALIHFCQVQGHFSEIDVDAGVFEHCAVKILGTPCRPPEKPHTAAMSDNRQHKVETTLENECENL